MRLKAILVSDGHAKELKCGEKISPPVSHKLSAHNHSSKEFKVG